MGRSRLGLCAALLFAGTLATGVSLAKGELNAEAKKRFDKGVDLYKKDNFVGALVEFKAAYEAEPNWKVHYNVGMTLYKLNRYVEAEVVLKEYLAEGGDDVPEAKGNEIKAILYEMLDYIGQIAITCEVTGAAVMVDGKPAGTTPLPSPVRVDVGEHTVKLVAEGFEPFEVDVGVPGGKEIEVKVSLVPLVAAGEVHTDKGVSGTTGGGGTAGTAGGSGDVKQNNSPGCASDTDCSGLLTCTGGRCMSDAERKQYAKPLLDAAGYRKARAMHLAGTLLGVAFFIGAASTGWVPLPYWSEMYDTCYIIGPTLLGGAFLSGLLGYAGHRMIIKGLRRAGVEPEPVSRRLHIAAWVLGLTSLSLGAGALGFKIFAFDKRDWTANCSGVALFYGGAITLGLVAAIVGLVSYVKDYRKLEDVVVDRSEAAILEDDGQMEIWPFMAPLQGGVSAGVVATF